MDRRADIVGCIGERVAAMNTNAWLIRYTVDGKQFATVHTHNAVADYRLLDPAATVVRIDCAAVAGLIEAAMNYEVVQGQAVSFLEVRITRKRLFAALANCKGESA